MRGWFLETGGGRNLSWVDCGCCLRRKGAIYGGCRWKMEGQDWGEYPLAIRRVREVRWEKDVYWHIYFTVLVFRSVCGFSILQEVIDAVIGRG